jgi:hypothetical protein
MLNSFYTITYFNSLFKISFHVSGVHYMRFAFSIIALSVLASSLASADEVVIPHTFSNGQVADATDVNANFKALADESNTNNTRIGVLEGGKFTTPFLSLSNNDKGTNSTLFGYEAGFNLAVASEKNSAFGYKALSFNTTGNANTATGSLALYFNTTGSDNTANGNQALQSNSTGEGNTANGSQSLIFNTEGRNNTANGRKALYSNETGDMNTAGGYKALYSNTTGSFNSANGYAALYFNTTGMNNTATGNQALYSNTTGEFNTANGMSALLFNTSGSYNTATGVEALYSNTEGLNNTANGRKALYSNETGGFNSAEGYKALYSNQTGSFNAANGYAALYFNSTGSNNTATGNQALNENRTGSNNTAIGALADVMSANLSNATAIGYDAKVSRSNKIRLGNTSVTIIEGQVPLTTTSDIRLKEYIQTTRLGLDFINDLNPVQYHRINNKEADLELGIIAQELKAVLEKHHARDSGMVQQVDDGYMSVRYNDLIAPLIKSVQELSVENLMLKEASDTKIAKLEAELAAHKSQMVELKALILASTAN